MRTAKDFHIFDVHHHAGQVLGFASTATHSDAKPTTMEDDIATRVSFMEKHGIDQAMIMPGSGASNLGPANDYVAKYRAADPGHFPAAVGSVNPLDGAAAVAELNRCIDVLGMNGMVWHHRFCGMVINHPTMIPLLDRIKHYRVPAFVHIIADSMLESPWRLQKLADAYPDTTFVALDGFSSPNHVAWMFYIAEKTPNIVFDTGVMMSLHHQLDEFVDQAGADRLLLGTDAYAEPHFHTAFPINELLASHISDENLRKVFGGNLKRLLKLA